MREVVFPAVTGGEQTLRELVHEYKTKGPVYRRTVQTTLKASYTNHYRKGLIELLDVLEFRVEQRHPPAGHRRPGADHAVRQGRQHHLLPAGRGGADRIEGPIGRVGGPGVPGGHPRPPPGGRAWCTRSSRSRPCASSCAARRSGSSAPTRWRNPDEDLPADFEARRVENYGELRKPLDPAVVHRRSAQEMTAALADLNTAVPDLGWVEIAERKAGAIKFTAPEASEEPRNLRRVKNEVQRRWDVVPLIDMLKEAVLRTGCLNGVTAVAAAATWPPEVLAERLMLAIYAYGTNTGIRVGRPAAPTATPRTRSATSGAAT